MAEIVISMYDSLPHELSEHRNTLEPGVDFSL